jgi:hypothetical protein
MGKPKDSMALPIGGPSSPKLNWNQGNYLWVLISMKMTITKQKPATTINPIFVASSLDDLIKNREGGIQHDPTPINLLHFKMERFNITSVLICKDQGSLRRRPHRAQQRVVGASDS